MTRFKYFILSLLLVVVSMPLAADTTTPKTYSEVGKPLYEQTDYYTADGKNIIKFSNHIALVGPHCLVNRLFSTVKVGSLNHDLDNLTDSTLDNEASFPSLVQANLGFTPIVSVRDMKRHYAPNTPAGFCVDASSGKSILKLDVGKTYIIRFFREGQFVDQKTVSAGKSIEGVNLSLVQLPGSKNVCFNVEATPTQEYDEIELCTAQGVNVDVATNTKLKYAYVGTANVYTLTNNPATEKESEKTEKNLEDYCNDMGRKPAVATVNWGLGTDKVIDADLTNFRLNLPVSVGISGIDKVTAKPTSDDTDQSDLFKAGTMVGFKMKAGSLLKLSVGTFAHINLYDKNGKKVQSEDCDASVLGLQVISGGDRTVSLEAKHDFSTVEILFPGLLNVDLGGTGVYYAFVTPAPTKADHHCPIGLTADLSLCNKNKTIQLEHNPNINITKWEVESAMAADGKTDVSKECTVDNTGLVTFAHTNDDSYNGTYVIKATAADGCYETITLTRGIAAGAYASGTCENKIENISGQTAEYALADNSHGGGSLLSISVLKKPSNIFDGNTNTCASWTGGVQIAQNVEIVGVKRADGTSFTSLLKDKTHSIRVGFVVEATSTGLNLNLLDGFMIKCYNSKSATPNNAVASVLVSDSKVLGLSLAGSNHVQKVEFAATIPAGTDFDEFTLWSTGTLNLSISTLNIYYPFYEDGSDAEKCNNQLAGSTQVSNSATGATISAGGSNASLVTVGGFMENLGNAVDDDPNYETAVTWGNGVQAGSYYSFGIKLGRTYDYRHQLAVVMNKDVNHYLSVNAGNYLKIETYYKGKATGDSKNSWQVLGADVLTTQDRDIYLMSPKQQYDEVVITMGAVANVADVQKLYGIALLSDADGDGVPDNRDDNSCEDPKITDLKMTSVCEGENSTISWKGTDKTANYQVFVPAESFTTKVSANSYGSLNFSVNIISLKKVGDNQVAYILDESGNTLGKVYYKVYPTTTHWRTNAASTDWNNWDNWVEGAPSACSNVIIPAGAKVYPVLTDVSTDVDKDYENACNGIHFEHDAAVENVYRLKYNSAWVDLALTPGVTRLYMSPVQSLVSGDFFASKIAEKDYFTPLTDDNATKNKLDVVDRVTYPLIQRVWENTTGDKVQFNMNSDMKTATPTTISVETSRWSNGFNSLAYDYATFSGSSKTSGTTTTVSGDAPLSFALMAAKGNTDTCFVHLPKSGARTYYYYDNSGNKLSTSVAPSHASAKLWSDNWSNGDELNLTYKNTSDGNGSKTDGIFLVGNPMMSHLNVKSFLEATANANSNNITGVKCYDGNTAYSVILVNGSLVSSSDLASKNLYVGPAQAFFVMQKGTTTTSGSTTMTTYKATQTVTYSKDMYGGQPASSDELYQSTASAAKGYNADEEVPSFLRVKADAGNYHVGTVLLQDNDTKAPTLIDEDYKPQFAIFSEEGGKAYDIRPVDQDFINLGFFMTKADSVRLSFETSGAFDASDWKLYDRETGDSYALDAAPTVWMNGDNVGRFYLSRIGAATGVNTVSEANGALVLSVSDGVATVKASKADLSSLTAYDEAGQLLTNVTANHAAKLSVAVPSGVVVLRATCADGHQQSWKVIVM